MSTTRSDDIAALRRALARFVKLEPFRKKQFRDLRLTGVSFVERGMLAAEVCQRHYLSARPWQAVPATVDFGAAATLTGIAADQLKAWSLAARLVDAGLSLFEPNPATALVARERRARAMALDNCEAQRSGTPASGDAA
jgi:hypothetical protein